MIKVGLTGGIGSGKTTIAKIFEVLGIPVYYADLAGKRLMNENDQLRKGIIDTFGEKVYVNGKLDPPYLSSLVFNDPSRLDQLNALVHPAVLKDAEEWMMLQNAPYAIKEAALIFESGANIKLNYVIGVHAPEELRMQRAMNRDNISREDILARMNQQMSEKEKMNRCDFIITNDECQLVTPQVIALHNKFTVLSKEKQHHE